MADNMSIRVSDDVKERFNELAAASDVDNKGDFLDQLLLVYQSEMTKRELPILKEAIEASQAFMWRLTDIFQGVSAAISIERERSQNEMECQKSSFEGIRTLLEQRLNNVQNELAESEARAENILTEKQELENKILSLDERVKQADAARIQQGKQVEDSLNDKNALIDELKSKVSNLNEMVVSFQAAVNERDALRENMVSLKHENTVLKNRIDEVHEKIKQQAGAFDTEKVTLLREAELQKGVEILELRQAHQDQLEEYQRKHNESIAAYELKIRDIWSLLESVRTKED